MDKFGYQIKGEKDYVVIGAPDSQRKGSIFIYKHFELIDSFEGTSIESWFGADFDVKDSRIMVGARRNS